jgi:plastocyanin
VVVAIAAAVLISACIDFSLENPFPAQGPSGSDTADSGGGGGADGGSDAGTSTGGTTHTVIIKNFAYNPSSITIRVGDTVTWLMQDTGEIHFVTEGTPDSNTHVFASPRLSPGQSYSRRFTEPATWTYFCEAHPSAMSGARVVVQP